MVKQRDENRPLSKVEETMESLSGITADTFSSSKLESWNGSLDLSPYKKAAAWPGRSYCLLGNSFNVEINASDSAASLKRAHVIASTLSQSKASAQCLSVKEALTKVEFVGVLSRFENDWLARLSADTLLGPAYDDEGKLIDVAFSVWRPELVAQSKTLGRR